MELLNSKVNHGVSIVLEMARKTDTSDRRIYRSFSGEKPTRAAFRGGNGMPIMISS